MEIKDGTEIVMTVSGNEGPVDLSYLAILRILHALRWMGVTWSDLRLGNIEHKVGALNEMSPSLAEALNSGDGTYKP